MQKLKTIALGAAIVLTFAATVHAQTIRDSYGPKAAPAIDAVIPQLYPGGHLEWSPGPTLVTGDTRKHMRIAEPLIRDEADGFTFVVSLEFTDNEVAIATTMNGMAPATDSSLTEIVAFKTTQSFAVTSVHRGMLATDASITRVVSLELAPDAPPLDWPRVYVTYKAFYSSTDMVGMFEWQSQVTTNPVVMVHKLPGLIARSTRDGVKITERPVIIPREDDAFDIYSKDQARFIMTCVVPCVPDGKVLLGLWGQPTSSTIVATTP